VITINENEIPHEVQRSGCPVRRGNWIIQRAESAGLMMPLIVNKTDDGAIVVRGVRRETIKGACSV